MAIIGYLIVLKSLKGESLIEVILQTATHEKLSYSYNLSSFSAREARNIHRWRQQESCRFLPGHRGVAQKIDKIVDWQCTYALVGLVFTLHHVV